MKLQSTSYSVGSASAQRKPSASPRFGVKFQMDVGQGTRTLTLRQLTSIKPDILHPAEKIIVKQLQGKTSDLFAISNNVRISLEAPDGGNAKLKVLTNLHIPTDLEDHLLTHTTHFPASEGLNGHQLEQIISTAKLFDHLNKKTKEFFEENPVKKPPVWRS